MLKEELKQFFKEILKNDLTRIKHYDKVKLTQYLTSLAEQEEVHKAGCSTELFIEICMELVKGG